MFKRPQRQRRRLTAIDCILYNLSYTRQALLHENLNPASATSICLALWIFYLHSQAHCPLRSLDGVTTAEARDIFLYPDHISYPRIERRGHIICTLVFAAARFVSSSSLCAAVPGDWAVARYKDFYCQCLETR